MTEVLLVFHKDWTLYFASDQHGDSEKAVDHWRGQGYYALTITLDPKAADGAKIEVPVPTVL